MKTLVELISFENAVFQSYVFWMCIMIIKMLLMSPLTVINRIRTQTYPNVEDAALFGVKIAKFNNEHVERVRRAHRNDMENILPMLIVGYFYVLTNPSIAIATLLFKIAGLCRICHTVVYTIFVLPQPARGIVFFFPIAITMYMALYTLSFCW